MLYQCVMDCMIFFINLHTGMVFVFEIPMKCRKRNEEDTKRDKKGLCITTGILLSGVIKK